MMNNTNKNIAKKYYNKIKQYENLLAIQINSTKLKKLSFNTPDNEIETEILGIWKVLLNDKKQAKFIANIIILYIQSIIFKFELELSEIDEINNKEYFVKLESISDVINYILSSINITFIDDEVK